MRPRSSCFRLFRFGLATAAAALAAFGAGCRVPCERPDAPCDGSGQLRHGGRNRTFLYHLPPNLPEKPALVVGLHGRLGTARAQKSMGMDAVADREGWVTVYPDGIDRSWADGRGTTPADQQGIDDVGFLTALIDHALERFGADPARVYVTGISNGGMMTLRMACERAERIAAIGPVAAILSVALADRCQPSRPVPMIGFVGTEDPLVPFDGGPVGGDRGDVLSAEDFRSRWASQNGCEAEPAVEWLDDVAPDDGTRIRRERHTACAEGAAIDFYVVEGGGHTWPGGSQYLPESMIGRVSQDVSAVELQGEFLRRFAR